MAGPFTAEALRERWLAMAFSTKPVDREVTEKKIKAAYFHAGLGVPRKFMWFPSPASAILAIGALKASPHTSVLVTDGIRHQIHNQVFQDAIGAIPASSGVGHKVGSEVMRDIRNLVNERVRDQIMAQLIEQTRNFYAFNSTAKMGLVYDRVVDAVRKYIPRFDDFLKPSFENINEVALTLRHCRWGWNEEYWLAAHEAYIRGAELKPSQDTLNRFLSLVQIRENLTIFFPFADLVICSENPLVLKRDERNRLHAEAGPAIVYPDGWGVWAWRGVRVPQNIIEHPEEIIIGQVETQENAEIRRVMIERMGWEKFIRQSNLKPIQSDDWGTLYKKVLPGEPEPLMLVKVTNSTPEPDGHYKDYILRVHHELRPLLDGNVLGDPQKLTALNAIASTFGLKGEEYKKVLVQT